MNLIQDIVGWHDELTAIRREIHAFPEIAYEEEKTSALVARLLTEYGLEVHAGIGRTGVVGVLRAGASERAIALRADMDALPMTELNDFPHRSTRPGRMHACGHDGHTTMLLAAARYLSRHRNFDGTVYFLFQPAEEGGHAGARAMIQDGLFDRFPCQQVFGIHNMPGIETGKFAILSGPAMAASSLWDIFIQGQGGHAAQPHRTEDTVVLAAQMTQALQSVISRRRDPLAPAVLSITQIHAGEAYNVLPDRAQLCGTVRTFDASTLDQIETDMRKLAEALPALHGGSGTLDFRRNYPAVINDAQAAGQATQVVARHLGTGHLDTTFQPTMAGEDFSFYLQHVPGAFLFLGNGMGEHHQAAGPCQLHNPYYDFNDALLPIGATFWVHLVQDQLAVAG